MTKDSRIARRDALALLGAAGAAALGIACGDSPTSPSPNTTNTTTTQTATGGTTTTTSACEVTPNETAGPFPSRTDIFRSDVREGKPGTPLTLSFKVVNAAAGCAPVANALVEIWQCDHVGDYSQYGTAASQTFLRGIQTTNESGDVTFVTSYPGWYQGRATHIHVEVTAGGRSVKVTQIAFPESINNLVHTSGVYASRGVNPTTNARDGIFSDSLNAELVTPVGSVAGGYTASFQVGVTL